MSQQRQFKGLPSFTPSPPEHSSTWFPSFQLNTPPNVQQPQWLVQLGQTSHYFFLKNMVEHAT
ncbi:MAG: hypothetical protein ACJ795_14890 [Ktedonobacteraceae bacterium]